MILCIETSGAMGSVALAGKDGKCLKIRIADSVNAHAEQIPVMVSELLDFAVSQGENIEAVAVNKGPGSYTGLRIGSSLAKGLCFGCHIPLIACDGLEMMARQAARSGFQADVYICMLDARRDEVFFAIYNSRFEVLEPLSAMVLAGSVWSEYRAKNVVFCGDATSKLKRLVPSFQHYPEYSAIPDASWFCEDAARKFSGKNWADVAYFEPDYGKAFYTGTMKK